MSAESDPVTRWHWGAPMIFASSGFLLMTAVAVGQLLRVIGSFEQMFKELGIQIPKFTQFVLDPLPHILVGGVLAALIVVRHHDRMREWATALWVVCLLTYIALAHIGLFEPLIRLVEQLGMSASG